MNRAEKLLKSIVIDENLVELHEGWGYTIRLPFEEIHKIGLIEIGDRYELSLYFADSQSQSRAFYATNPKIERLSKDWLVHGNFHFSSSFGRGIIWFGSDLNAQEYINYWRKNTSLLHQYRIDDAKTLFNKLIADKVVKLDTKKRNELNEKVFSKDYSVLNISAGLGVIYSIPKSKIENGRLPELKELLISKINEGLSIIGKDGRKFLKEGDPVGF